MTFENECTMHAASLGTSPFTNSGKVWYTTFKKSRHELESVGTTANAQEVQHTSKMCDI